LNNSTKKPKLDADGGAFGIVLPASNIEDVDMDDDNEIPAVVDPRKVASNSADGKAHSNGTSSAIPGLE